MKFKFIFLLLITVILLPEKSFSKDCLSIIDGQKITVEGVMNMEVKGGASELFYITLYRPICNKSGPINSLGIIGDQSNFVGKQVVVTGKFKLEDNMFSGKVKIRFK